MARELSGGNLAAEEDSPEKGKHKAQAWNKIREIVSEALHCTAKSRAYFAVKTSIRGTTSVSLRAKRRKTARLEARIPSSLKEILMEAARLTGHASLSSYIVQTLQDSAFRTVDQAHRTQLDASQSAAFAESLLSPRAPVPALQADFAAYRDQVR